jgi:hypothetical protein
LGAVGFSIPISICSAFSGFGIFYVPIRFASEHKKHCPTHAAARLHLFFKGALIVFCNSKQKSGLSLLQYKKCMRKMQIQNKLIF